MRNLENDHFAAQICQNLPGMPSLHLYQHRTIINCKLKNWRPVKIYRKIDKSSAPESRLPGSGQISFDRDRISSSFRIPTSTFLLFPFFRLPHSEFQLQESLSSVNRHLCSTPGHPTQRPYAAPLRQVRYTFLR